MPTDEDLFGRLRGKRLTIDGTDYAVDVSEADARAVYIPLARTIAEDSTATSGGRFLVGIAGPPGAGKTVTARVLHALLQDLGAASCMVPADGFHFANSYLQSHEGIAHDGATHKLVDLKGWHTTFDVAKLLASLVDIRRGETVSVPVYSRILHDTVENAFEVDQGCRIVIVEGNYLFLPVERWESVRELFDLKVFVTAAKDVLCRQILERHIRGGRSEASASEKIRNVDGPNMDAVLPNISRSEVVIAGERGSLTLTRTMP